MSRVNSLFSRLYPILDAGHETKNSLEGSIESLGRAGCRLVQVRAKKLSARDFLEWAELAVETGRSHGIAIIVNDRADIALLSGASGVHLGQDDLSVASARRLLGDEAIVGLSTHSIDQAREGSRLAVDYLAIGPVYATVSKERPDAALGVDTIREVRRVVAKPLVAIGGITIDRARELFEAGVDAVAVISALRRAIDGGTLEDEAKRWLSLQ